MASITPYISEGACADQVVQVRVKNFRGWAVVGTGRITHISDYAIALEGNIRFHRYTGDLTIDLRLVDEVEPARTGRCRIQVNDHIDDDASYSATGRSLSIDAAPSGDSFAVEISRQGKNETELHVAMGVNVTCRLVPQ